MREMLFKGRKISDNNWICGRLVYSYFNGDDRYSIVPGECDYAGEVSPETVTGVFSNPNDYEKYAERYFG